MDELTYSYYIFSFFLNLAIMIYIIKWRGLFSAEGLGMAFLTLVVASDGIGLFIIYLTGSNALNLSQEAELRLLPNIVLTTGLFSFLSGLAASGSSCARLSHEISDSDNETRKKAVFLGWFLVALGLFMKAYALYSWGFSGIGEYILGIYMYQATKRGGGFMDDGLNIAVLGLSLLVALYGKRPLRQVLIVSLALALSFLLSPSKSGINIALITLFFTMYVFDRNSFKKYFRPFPIAILLVILFFGLGVKAQIKYGFDKKGTDELISGSDIFKSMTVHTGRRYGPDGLYRGYCFFVNRMMDDGSLYFRGTILRDTLTSWVPGFVRENKPEHPFHAKGDLISEFQTIDVYGNEAPTFAGYAFADYGLLSVVLYLFAGGVTLGLIRKSLRSRLGVSNTLMLAYIFFSINISNAMAESGFLGLLYFIIFSIALALLMIFVLAIKRAFSAAAVSAWIETRRTDKPSCGGAY